jgi:predicted negative regulator of RcsB-dependent stress response
MARDALTKDELRHDPLQEWFFHAIDYVHKRRNRFLAGGVALLVVIAGGAGFFLYSRMHVQRVAAAFNAAEARLLDTHIAQAEQIAKAREGFKAFLADYGSSALAPYASMHLAGLAASEGKLDEAEAAYQSVIDHGDAPPSLRVIARTALAKLYEDKGDLQRSAEIYRSLTGEAYGDLAEFSLARVAIAEHKADQARTHLEAVEKDHPDSALAKLARDVLFFVH